jgi:hypothetical protein
LMGLGEHIYVKGTVRGIPFEHHGIDMGDGSVIHLAPETGPRVTLRDSTGLFSVRQTTLLEFSGGREIQVRRHFNRLDDDSIAENARSGLGLTGYSLLAGNCEHFATWCATGRANSHQIEMGAAAVSSVASAVTKSFWTATARMGTQVAVRGAVKLHPASILADGVEILMLAVGCRRGLEADDAKRVARVSGSLTALGLGLILAGPGGAVVSLAAHSSSTAISDRLCTRVRHWLG